ncbi:MAG TPA: hypothetical protein VG818_01975 [Gemmatimonadaceae bacterium]|jgi:hypothetical protein|nr:hypothetical protein [Gemmatimonadaceae bacterium]
MKAHEPARAAAPPAASALDALLDAEQEFAARLQDADREIARLLDEARAEVAAEDAAEAAALEVALHEAAEQAAHQQADDVRKVEQDVAGHVRRFSEATTDDIARVAAQLVALIAPPAPVT